MNIIELLKSTPEGTEFIVDESGKFFVGLKALAESHERLRDLLREMPHDYTSAEDGEVWRLAKNRALDEAEKLNI